MGFSPTISPGTAPASLARLPGYGPGAQVMTDLGELPVDWLAAGDRVLTRDHGFQPVLWLARTRLGSDEVLCEIPAGALGYDRPSHPTLFAPHTRVLFSGWEVALNTGADEALAEIGELNDSSLPARPWVPPGTLITHLLLPMHEVVQVNGLWAETLLLDTATRLALEEVLPPDVESTPEVAAGHAHAAWLCLTGWEVAAILGTARAAPEVIGRVA